MALVYAFVSVVSAVILISMIAVVIETKKEIEEERKRDE